MGLHDFFFMTTISGLHNGSGQSSGFIDNPIIREEHTLFPFVQSASLKGALRESFGEDDETRVLALFGPPPPRGDSHGGAVSLSDASLLAFPIRSLKGHFVWATTPHLLYRMSQIFHFNGKQFEELGALLKTFTRPVENIIFCPDGAAHLCIENRIVLEEFSIPCKSSDKLQLFAKEAAGMIFPGDDISYLKDSFCRKLVVLEDNLFRHFMQFATEIQPNIRINNKTGTTAIGSLRYTEYLPSETVLYFITTYSPARIPSKEADVEAFEKFKNEEGKEVNLMKADKGAGSIREIFRRHRPEILQIGGYETTGKGIVSLQAMPGEAE